MTDRTKIDCSPGNFVATINGIEGYCRDNLFVKSGRLYRRAPDGLNYAVTAPWFAQFLMRRFTFVDRGQAVMPPGFLLPQIRARLAIPPHEIVPRRYLPVRGFR